MTETVAGEIVTLMLVTGSVHVEVEVELDEPEVLVEQVTAVLAGAAPHEASPRTAASKANARSVFTPPRSFQWEIPDTCRSVATLNSRTQNGSSNISTI